MTARARRLLAIGAVLAAVGFPLVAMRFDLGFYVGFVNRVMIFALAATSLNLALGFCGLASFGHAAFVGVGAYTVAILAEHAAHGSLFGVIPGTTSAWIAWPAAAATSGVVAALIGAICLRTRGIHFIMITLAFAQMLYFFTVSLKTYGGDDGLNLAHRSDVGLGVRLADDTHFYYVVLALLCAALYLMGRLVRSRFGRAIVGIRENEVRMEAIGFPVFQYKWVCFAIAGALAGIAGALLANHNAFVSPNALHWTQSGMLLVMVLVGGRESLFGGVLGAATLLGLEEVFSAWTTHWQLPVGAILLALVYLAPRGIAGLFGREPMA